ncbi:10046_t:CDS:2 [Funneliformis mosseae]|uniref:10046_t:CDS:1 n=1 Tax=Funneliformis mosseae TaxID=27381 RepID=A0A9N9CEV8_FUNMO|nr:10046_t:CDS:2 [Funneliformis mosseae]
MDWRSLVSTDERLTNILRIAELAHAVQPFQEVLNRAKQVEESVFQKATSREFYIASMDQLVDYMKKTIEDKTKQHLEQLAEKEYKELLNSKDSSIKSSKNGLDQLKNLWTRRINEIMEQSRRQQAFQSQRLHLLLQNLQLQQLLQQQKTRQTQPTNLPPLLQPLPQPTIPILQSTPLITQQSLTMRSTAPLTKQTKSEQSQSSQSSLPQAYCLVKDANVHKEDFKEALKLPINEQKRHPPPGAPVIPVHALKVEGVHADTSSQSSTICRRIIEIQATQRLSRGATLAWCGTK